MRRARELKQLTQADLADRSGAFTAAALSQIERGHTKPSTDTLAAISAVTGMPESYFQARVNSVEPVGFFRSLSSLRATTRKSHLARASALRELVQTISLLVRLPDDNVPRFTLTEFGSVEEIAAEVRRGWDVEPGPVESVVRLIERNGCVVVRQDGFEKSIDAYSVRYPDHSVVVLGNTKGKTARSRFDAAHELGHLVMHADADAAKSATEKQANAFASAFLMPATDIIESLPSHPDFDHLLELKVQWRVSIAALMYRSRTLGVMSDANFTRGMKAISARGWRKNEPGDNLLGAPEEPSLLHRAANLIAQHGTSTAELAEKAGLPLDLVEELLASGGDFRPVLEV